MITYDIFKQENYSALLNFAKKFNIPNRKGKKQEARFIVLKKFENKNNMEGAENKKEKNIYIERKEEILNGMMFEKFSISDIRKNLDKIIFCNINEKNKSKDKSGKDDKILSEMTKYNEIDVIVCNEIIDKVSCKNMYKNFISLAFGFSEILNCWGIRRVKKLAIMKKNFQMAKKYGVNYIISTFAGNIFEYKPVETLISFGKVLGMSDEESRNAVSKNYENIIKKFNDRNDENLLTDGLRVLKFGKVKRKKKKYGYY